MKLTPFEKKISVRFPGDYIIITTENAKIKINGKKYKTKEYIHLNDKEISYSVDQDVYLKFIPENLNKILISQYYEERDIHFTYEF